MKKITTDFFEKVFEESIIEYTKNRFISEEEYEELKESIVTSLEERLAGEKFEDGKIVLTFTDI